MTELRQRRIPNRQEADYDPGNQRTIHRRHADLSGKRQAKDKHKFQTEVFQQNKDKSNVQDSGSSGASSGSGQGKHHKKH